MNQTEARFERDYLEGRRAQRLNEGWMFEQVKLRLATGTWYTVDFAERLIGGGLHMHEVKGGKIWDDAAVKWKVAAEQYPWWSWTLWQWSDGRWRRLREWEP